MPATKNARPDAVSEIAAHWHLDEGVGFLLRLLEARYDALYQSMTRQTDITPRQFGVLMALYQHGPLTPSALADRISCDRNTLSEMLKRMVEKKLVAKKQNAEDRRSFQVQISTKGSQALLAVVPAAAELQNVLLAPLKKEDRAHFMACLRTIAKPPTP